MRPDQHDRLDGLSVRLAETVIRDADPDNWSANDTRLCDMSKEERGNANWCRKTAVQSVALLTRVEQLLGERDGRGTPRDDDDTDAEIKRAEKSAAALLERVSGRSHAGG